jgi:hypothetical protein
MPEIIQYINTIWVSLFGIIKVTFRDWHVRKFINFSNLLKLIFLYSASLIWIIFFEMDYSKNFWSKAIEGNFSERKFSFYTTRDRIGEGVLYDRMVVTADKLAYDYSAFKFPESLSRFWLTSHFYKASTSIVNYIFKPQFNLALTHHVSILPIGYNITYLNMPLDALFGSDGDFLPQWDHLEQYDAYVDLYSLVHTKNELLQKVINITGENKPIIALYFAKNEEIYQALSFDRALITGTLWGCNRSSLRVAQSLKKLADNGFLVGIGVEEYLDFLGKAYLGKMESFGNTLESLQSQQQKYGIALIIHNQEHMLDGIPTSRIAEAAASGALIISDQNKFLINFFGDSVLYYDAFADSDQIYNDIKSHIQWARANPSKSHAKTQKAYKIFMDNFTMENQLDKLFAIIENSSIEF